MKKEKSKTTKVYLNKELKRLRNKALKLWKLVVKNRAGNKCEYCGDEKLLNAHHIESYMTNKFLRFSPENGLALCPLNHKWGKKSAHKSAIFSYLLMEKRPKDLRYLIDHAIKHWDDKFEWTKENLLNKIKELEEELNGTGPKIKTG
jgi:hypothetical protein